MKYLLPFVFILSISFKYEKITSGDSIFVQTMKKDSLVHDFSILYSLLNTVHPGEFMHCEKSDFDKCYDSLSKTIQADLSVYDYYRKVSFLVSKIKDGHTSVDNSPIKNQLQKKLVFPFSVFKIQDRFIVSKSGIKEYDSLIGNTILKINNKSFKEIFSEIKPYVSVEGENETGINYTYRLFPFYYFLVDTSSLFNVEYIDSSGTTKFVILPGMPFEDYIKNIRKIVPPIQQEFRENNLAILTLNTFDIGDFEYAKIDYKKYIARFFKKVRKLKIENLIIDVRGNSGGSAEVSNYLFSFLTNKEYYYFNYVGKKYKTAGDWKSFCITPQYLNNFDTMATQYRNGLYCKVETDKKDFWWFEKQKGKENYYNGNLITLIDGGCFSTTGHFVALLKNNQIGKLYGECTQGSYYSNGGQLMFQLPYSKLLVSIPTAQYKMRMPNFEYDSKGICPDVEIIKRQEDFKTNYDRQLNFSIQQLIK